MPRLLLARCGLDCVREFRASARLRYNEGVALSDSHKTAAIYLWGYAAEMTLKAAYFTLIGFADTREITRLDLRTALGGGHGSTAASLGMSPSGNFHNLGEWAQLLILYRDRHGPAYSDPLQAAQVIDNTGVVYRHWRETLRYRRNVAYQFEMKQV
jgi:hypothetical protein